MQSLLTTDICVRVCYTSIVTYVVPLVLFVAPRHVIITSIIIRLLLLLLCIMHIVVVNVAVFVCCAEYL